MDMPPRAAFRLARTTFSLSDDAAYHLDSTKVRTELGWQEHISLDQGLDECIRWVREYFDILKQQPYDYLHKP